MRRTTARESSHREVLTGTHRSSSHRHRHHHHHHQRMGQTVTSRRVASSSSSSFVPLPRSCRFVVGYARRDTDHLDTKRIAIAAAAADDDTCTEDEVPQRLVKHRHHRTSPSTSRRAAILTTLTAPTAAALTLTSSSSSSHAYAYAAAQSAPPAPLPEWGYADSSNGPSAWGTLKNPDGSLAFPDCGCRACAQSPINLPSRPTSSSSSSDRVGTLSDHLVRSKRPLTLKVSQKHGTPNYVAVAIAGDGSEEEKEGGAFGGVMVDGVFYSFVSLHFHTPAENTIDGVAYPMEMHLVHVAEDGSGSIAVVGVLFQHSSKDNPADPTVAELLTHIEDEENDFDNDNSNGGRDNIKNININKGGWARRRGRNRTTNSGSSKRNIVTVSPGSLWDDGSGYYEWSGSLTTPPCTGNVHWFLQRNIRAVSAEQCDAFKKHAGGFPGNARPTQPLNGRTVKMYSPPSSSSSI